MVSRQRSIWLWLGLMAATGAGLSLAPAPAEAQILDRNRPFQAPPSRPKLPPDEPDPALSPDDQSITDAGWAADARPAGTPGRSADTQDGIDPQQAASREVEAQEAQEAQEGDTPINDVGDQGDTDEFGEARVRPRRLPPRDGDLPAVIDDGVLPNEGLIPNEGVIDLNAPSPLATGEDLTLADMRNARDLAIYAGIAPSFDPLLL